MATVFVGIDVGSVTTKFAAVDRDGELVFDHIWRTAGRPIETVLEGLAHTATLLPSGAEVAGVGTTGSGRQLAGALVGADLVKNEITAHAVAALHFVPAARTVIDIGGQDSKSFECQACPNLCEIAQIQLDGKVVARWGGRCDRWEGG